MRLSISPLPLKKPLVVAFALVGTAAALGASSDETPFLAENQAAMTKMMQGMAIKPSGDVDKDFIAMMVPHHQGAIEMAIAVLRYGHNEQLRRIAQEIIVTQRQEIAAMHLAVGDPLDPSVASPDRPSALQGAVQAPAQPSMQHSMRMRIPPEQ